MIGPLQGALYGLSGLYAVGLERVDAFRLAYSEMKPSVLSGMGYKHVRLLKKSVQVDTLVDVSCNVFAQGPDTPNNIRLTDALFLFEFLRKKINALHDSPQKIAELLLGQEKQEKELIIEHNLALVSNENGLRRKIDGSPRIRASEQEKRGEEPVVRFRGALYGKNGANVVLRVVVGSFSFEGPSAENRCPSRVEQLEDVDRQTTTKVRNDANSESTGIATPDDANSELTDIAIPNDDHMKAGQTDGKKGAAETKNVNDCERVLAVLKHLPAAKL